jgi:hypothetical protein
MKWLREGFALVELVALFLAVWFVIFGIPLGLGALARLAGAGQ